jgi:hypothetical protein
VNEPHRTEPSPAHVRELAESCVRFVQKATGLSLDFTPETLPLLDHYLSQTSRDKDAGRAMMATAAGAYLGEVVRAAYPCRWNAPQDDYGSWRIEFDHVFLHFNPVAFAHEAITSSEVVEGGAGFGVLDEDLETVRAGLEVLGTLNEEDYFKLSTRFEVLATVVDRLAGQSIASDEPAMRFDAQAYRAVLGEDHGPSKPS